MAPNDPVNFVIAEHDLGLVLEDPLGAAALRRGGYFGLRSRVGPMMRLDILNHIMFT